MFAWLFSPVVVFLVFGIALPIETSAKTVIVAPNGNDNNPGTLAKPVATPKQALGMVEMGDTIYLRAGRYTIDRFLWVDKAGLTISSYPNERAAIVGGPSRSPCFCSAWARSARARTTLAAPMPWTSPTRACRRHTSETY